KHNRRLRVRLARDNFPQGGGSVMGASNTHSWLGERTLATNKGGGNKQTLAMPGLRRHYHDRSPCQLAERRGGGECPVSLDPVIDCNNNGSTGFHVLASRDFGLPPGSATRRVTLSADSLNGQSLNFV